MLTDLWATGRSRDVPAAEGDLGNLAPLAGGAGDEGVPFKDCLEGDLLTSPMKPDFLLPGEGDPGI